MTHVQVYMLTSVVPARQSITGFPELRGGVLAPDADVRKLGLYKGARLNLMQLPPGQEVEPAHALTNHPVDIVGAKCSIIDQVRTLRHRRYSRSYNRVILPVNNHV